MKKMTIERQKEVMEYFSTHNSHPAFVMGIDGTTLKVRIEFTSTSELSELYKKGFLCIVYSAADNYELFEHGLEIHVLEMSV